MSISITCAYSASESAD
ncbi:hypothetical protein D020_3548A, partial [Vibrio parahaemolyticus SBR10290]